ncbi:hypothetical protein TYRP_009623 [Tyrophagus putrescentiae]|nr:hypothetical protein TYRP_009623 [Tyrophagus putrescentiae]
MALFPVQLMNSALNTDALISRVGGGGGGGGGGGEDGGAAVDWHGMLVPSHLSNGHTVLPQKK